jgi:hypothetical protein
LGGEKRGPIRESAKMLNKLLTTLVLETVTQEELEERLRGILQQVKRRNGHDLG